MPGPSELICDAHVRDRCPTNVSRFHQQAEMVLHLPEREPEGFPVETYSQARLSVLFNELKDRPKNLWIAFHWLIPPL